MDSLDQTQRIAAPLPEVFAFFSNPANLARITPPWLSFRLHGTAPETLAEGSRLEYRIRWSAFTIRWVTRITKWRAPFEFEDIQEKGPYASWIHTHRFAESDGVVVMQDHVDYALPFGPLGRLVHRLRVRRQLEQIFDYRRRAIDEIFPSPPSTLDPRPSTFSP
ncbi:MAG: SRPBCC family protein [Thermoanaerobaculia bacterium]